jgi:glycosyltransferase involved in cell wall biosynthesis
MATPRITAGLPAYRGADLIGKALESLQRQTYRDFEVIISVDGNDIETAAACQPYLVDSRVRMVVHAGRLDWAGNFNWLLQQDLREFFCYRQHDDTTAPEFFETLLAAADKNPKAAAVYCDCQFLGARDDLDIAPSIEGDALERMFEYIQCLPYTSAAPLRGLIRTAAIRQAGIVRTDEFRAPWQVYGWLAKLLRWGSFRRIPKALYYRLDHPLSYTNEPGSLPRKGAAWPTRFTGLLEAALPLCRTEEERRFFRRAILDRFIAYPREGFAGTQIVECLDRLKFEGNASLLPAEELAPIPELQRQLELLRHSRMRRAVHQIGQRFRIAKFIYTDSMTQRSLYWVRFLLASLGKAGKLLLSSAARATSR